MDAVNAANDIPVADTRRGLDALAAQIYGADAVNASKPKPMARVRDFGAEKIKRELDALAADLYRD